MISKTITLTIDSAEAMRDVGEKLARNSAKKMVIYLLGELGAGKTTLAQGFLRGLGYANKVKSPTYTIVEDYQFNDYQVYHFDFYRIYDPHELDALGLYEYFIGDSIGIIEWPHNAGKQIPEADINCKITILGEQRRLLIEACSSKGKQFLADFQKNNL